jgi:hypothetical protein
MSYVALSCYEHLFYAIRIVLRLGLSSTILPMAKFSAWYEWIVNGFHCVFKLLHSY